MKVQYNVAGPVQATQGSPCRSFPVGLDSHRGSGVGRAAGKPDGQGCFHLTSSVEVSHGSTVRGELGLELCHPDRMVWFVVFRDPPSTGRQLPVEQGASV